LRFFTNAKRGEKKAQRKKEIICMVGLNRANLIKDAYFFLHHALKSAQGSVKNKLLLDLYGASVKVLLTVWR